MVQRPFLLCELFMRLRTTIIFVFVLMITPHFIGAEEHFSSELVKDYRETLADILSESEGDSSTLKEIGKLHFFIGLETYNYDSVKEAIKIFENIIEKREDDSEVNAYLGAAYTVKARDFPYKWIVNLTPLGFIRVYYVIKGINLLDATVAQDSLNPIIRFIRCMTYANLPRIFLQGDKGMKDTELLLSWLENSLLNRKHSEMLTDKAFAANVYYRAGEIYLGKNEKEKAVLLFRRVISLLPDTPIARAALEKLNE